MPSRRGGRSAHRSNRATGSAMSTCNLPGDIIVEILSRLPVKSLMRFRCVCKPWYTLFTNPRFVARHLDRTTLNPNHNDDRDYILVQSRHRTSAAHTISLLQINKNPNVPLNLDHPFPNTFEEMDVVGGSINGLVCLSHALWPQFIILWNPATKQYKNLPNPTITSAGDRGRGRSCMVLVSIGFGFDAVADDYKVVRIVRIKREEKVSTRVEVYSVSADSWTEIKVAVPAVEFQAKCQAVVKGVPYWVTSDKRVWPCAFLVFFDLGNEVFRQVELPDFPGHDGSRASLVDFKGSVAVLAYSAVPVFLANEESSYCVDVWMIDECGGEDRWTKKFTFGPILGVERLLGRSKNGEIVLENAEGVLFLYDPQNKEIYNVGIDGAKARSFEVSNYRESLVLIKGAKQVGKEAKKDTTRGRRNR